MYKFFKIQLPFAILDIGLWITSSIALFEAIIAVENPTMSININISYGKMSDIGSSRN